MPSSIISVLHLCHFISGLDDELSEPPLKDGCAISISGYTEWLSSTMPLISVGWDWHLDLATGTPVYVRDGLPRTNLMAFDSASTEDMGDQKTGHLLATLIDHLGWQEAISEYLVSRYS